LNRAKRINRIFEILKDKGNASTKFLSKLLDVSESTIRRDIEFLGSMNKKVQRVHGGVVLNSSKHDLEYMFELKLNLNLELKRRIARKLLDYVDDSDSLIVDSGTTCLYASMELHHKEHLRVMTLDVKIAEELAKYENIESIVVGGLIRPGYYTIGESLALEMLDHFRVDKTILSADAIDLENGVTNFSIFEVGVKKKIIEMAKTVILLADHTKFGNTYFYKVANLSKFSTIISTNELEKKFIDGIQEMGVHLVLA